MCVPNVLETATECNSKRQERIVSSVGVEVIDKMIRKTSGEEEEATLEEEKEIGSLEDMKKKFVGFENVKLQDGTWRFEVLDRIGEEGNRDFLSKNVD